jgi:hypothetical protein
MQHLTPWRYDPEESRDGIYHYISDANYQIFACANDQKTASLIASIPEILEALQAIYYIGCESDSSLGKHVAEIAERALTPAWDGSYGATEFWQDTLCIHNISWVARRIREVLRGRFYTRTVWYENKQGRDKVEIRYNQALKPPRIKGSETVSQWSHKDDEDRDLWGITVSDTYGSWDMVTTAIDREFDPTYANPWITLTPNRIRIIQHQSNGLVITDLAIQYRKIDNT